MRPRPLPWTAQCSGSPSLQSLLPFSSLGRQSGYLERPTFLQQSSTQREKSIYPCIDASSGLFPGLTFTCPTCLGLSTALHPSIPGRKILLTYQCCLVPGSSTHWSPQTDSGNSTCVLAFNHTDKTAACFQSKSSSYLPWAFRSEKEKQILKALATSVILQVIKKNPSCGC